MRRALAAMRVSSRDDSFGLQSGRDLETLQTNVTGDPALSGYLDAQEYGDAFKLKKELFVLPGAKTGLLNKGISIR
jgi:hypothetical protein